MLAVLDPVQRRPHLGAFHLHSQYRQANHWVDHQHKRWGAQQKLREPQLRETLAHRVQRQAWLGLQEDRFECAHKRM
jgi:hypothetical protein